METKGLVFIPDISGFTRFVNETEINHSRLIIQELLEILINANQIGLVVSEIEGDAILFYKFGDPPALSDLYKQVERMFTDFHKSLGMYDLRKYCQCEACTTAVNLSLKIITHHGEFTEYTVKNFSKLIGKDIIVAHQLLKNDIDQHEYWLITQNLLQHEQVKDYADWMEWKRGARQMEGGEVAYQYAQLGPLKKDLPIELIHQTDLAKKLKLASAAREFDTDIITLFHASGDFRYRSGWLEGVKLVEELHHFLPRVGMRCRVQLTDGKEIFTYSSGYRYEANRIEFSETEESRELTTNYLLEVIDVKRTRLTLSCYIENSLLNKISAWFSGKEMEAKLHKSLNNLVPLAREIKVPTARN